MASPSTACRSPGPSPSSPTESGLNSHIVARSVFDDLKSTAKTFLQCCLNNQGAHTEITMRKALILRLVFVLTFFGAGVIFVAKNRADRNECWMTFMWGRIGFVRAAVDEGSSYSLLVYGENLQLRKLETNMRNALTGIPIVFVPGNAGSGYQARSLGSVLYNKTVVHGHKHVFDMFAVDFNEELSGLSVDYLMAQSKFLGKSVEKIRSLYRIPPKGIIFLGHSMGGVVIRSLLLNPQFDPSIMAAVITLATPHKESPLLLSSDVLGFWEDIEKAWAVERKVSVSHIPVVSLSAGFKDDLIHEAATRSPSVRHFSTTSLDRLWLEADHLCIVWCNQLVTLLSRFVRGYAESPAAVKRNPDAIIKRFFQTDGYERSWLSGPIRTLAVEKGKSLVALARRTERGSFISKPSRLLNHDWRIAEVLGPANVTVKEAAVFDVVPTDSLPSFNPSLWDTSLGLFKPIYTTDVKRRRITYLPVNLTDPTAVFKLRMEYTSCRFYNESQYPTRMIFDIGSTRRYSRASSPRSQLLKMYKIDAVDSGIGHVLIIANPKCNYQISIKADVPRIMMRPFQKHASSAVALFASYCIVSYCFQSLFPYSSFPARIFILLLGIQSMDTIALLLISLLVIVVYEIWAMFSGFLHFLLSNVKGFPLTRPSRLVLFTVLSGVACKAHSFPVLCIAALIGIRNANSSSLRNMYCAIIQLSIVPFVVYVWNLTRYGAISGLFPDHNLISALLLLLRVLVVEQWPWSYYSQSFHIRAFVFVNALVFLTLFYQYLRVFSQSVAILTLIVAI
ncbi:hypothetical protein QR680_003960 [Steinernema hermaphroditum]|uniref:GPI inositol-deacylase n=1 Tax=Steinernema hermaphroditum TaxID=289476 RepID=A0AA39LT76_9BILA|nr:hypothetical protein QR680_003960 [Steinernema hermaphroditum]